MRFLLLAILLVKTAEAQQSGPDLILTNGRIFTGDARHPWAEAVAVKGDRIMAVGTTAEIEASGRGFRTIDLGGRTVVPGFNDAHIHVSLGWPGPDITMFPGPFQDPARDMVRDSLRSISSRIPAGTWISVTIGPTLLRDSASRRAWLDSLAPAHPVRLHTFTGQATILNSSGLARLEIPDSIHDPLGGRYERGRDGRLTGLLQQYAQYMAPPSERHAPSTELMRAYKEGFLQVAGLGLTTLQDMEATEPEASAVLFAGADLPLRIRVMSFVHTTATGRRMGSFVSPGRPDRIGPHAYASGRKYILDGNPIEQTALMRRPYLGRPGWYGRLNFPVDTLRAILVEALEGDQQTMLHAVGDSTIALVLHLMAALAPDSAWLKRRVRLEHADMLAPDLFPLAKRLGVIVVQNPTHLGMGARFGQAYGAEMAGWLQPMRSLLDAGIPLALGSDGPPNPFLNIMAAVNNPHTAESLTREQAVRAYTYGSAYAEKQEGEKGMLAPGMLADLVVLSQDIFTIPVEALPGTTSVLTMMGGRIVHDAGVVGH